MKKVKTDARLAHLIKVKKQAQADINRYVKLTYPVDKIITFILPSGLFTGTVKNHGNGTVLIEYAPHGGRTLIHVPAENIRK